METENFKIMDDTTTPSEDEFLLKCRDVLEYLHTFVGDDRASAISFRYFWGRGTAKITINQKGTTYIGHRGSGEFVGFHNFVEGLHKQLVRNEGHPWYKPSNETLKYNES